jgi:hypothetical protein
MEKKIPPSMRTGREAPFRSEIRSHLKGQTEALEGRAVELLARGPLSQGHRGRLPRRERPAGQQRW